MRGKSGEGIEPKSGPAMILDVGAWVSTIKVL